jgi:hypothetical protein
MIPSEAIRLWPVVGELLKRHVGRRAEQRLQTGLLAGLEGYITVISQALKFSFNPALGHLAL